jgi:hypothetical protein
LLSAVCFDKSNHCFALTDWLTDDPSPSPSPPVCTSVTHHQHQLISSADIISAQLLSTQLSAHRLRTGCSSIVPQACGHPIAQKCPSHPSHRPSNHLHSDHRLRRPIHPARDAYPPSTYHRRHRHSTSSICLGRAFYRSATSRHTSPRRDRLSPQGRSDTHPALRARRSSTDPCTVQMQHRGEAKLREAAAA